MVRATILFLLACGGVVIQASPWDVSASTNIFSNRRNANVNTNIIGRRNVNANTNIIGRRNANANTNMNIIGRRNVNANTNLNIIGQRNANANDFDAVPMHYDGVDDGVNPATFDNMHRKIYKENDPSIASVAVAAGHAAYAVMKDFAAEMSEAVSNAVIDAVANILRRQNAMPYNRRNSNVNSNTNIVGGGGGALGNGASGGGASRGGSFADNAPGKSVYPNELTIPQGSGGSGSGLTFGLDGFAVGHAGRYADEEEEEEVEEVDNTPKEIEIVEEDVEDGDSTASRSLGDHYWRRPRYGWPRNFDTDGKTDLNDYPRKMRRNINANTNVNIIGHRRSLG